MKVSVSIAALAILALSVAGCQSVLSTSTNIAAAAPTVCANLQAAGALTVAIANQVIASNPNNTQVQMAATKVIAGAVLTANDCAAIAAVVQLANGTIQAGASVAK